MTNRAKYLFGLGFLTIQLYSNPLPDLSGYLIESKGNKASTELFDGKIVCLYFSAEWCGPCKTFTPHLIDFYNRYHQYIEIVFVSQDKSEAQFWNHVTESRMP